MNIAQVAPLVESVPPRAYGGTERVVSYLTEALVEMGHEVTLFASGDSQTCAILAPFVSTPRVLVSDANEVDPKVVQGRSDRSWGILVRRSPWTPHRGGRR